MADQLRLARFSSPVGDLTAGEIGGGIALLAFGGPQDNGPAISRLGGRASLSGMTPVLSRLELELAAYFEGRLRSFSVPLRPAGTPFQRRTWDALLSIPYGETRSYAELARMTGNPKAVRAVGSANGRNPVTIVIPCHRVIASGGGLGGYGGGLERKRMLLDLETAALI